MEIFKPDICIYHGNCPDGFGAAWAVWKKWPDVEFIPGVYGNEPPDVRGKNVLMVDFSYKRPVIEEMALSANSITIIDHHKTAEADLKYLDSTVPIKGTNSPIKVLFDMEKSGAVLTWMVLHPKEPIPAMLLYIQGRDLWRFTHGDNTHKVALALNSYTMEFEVWDNLARNMSKLIDEGGSILRQHTLIIEKLVAESYLVKWHDQMVPCCNVPHLFASDVGNALLKKFPSAPFAMTAFRRGDKVVQVSLRSEDHRFDVSEIAKVYGGGGHRNAAGFQWSMEIY